MCAAPAFILSFLSCGACKGQLNGILRRLLTEKEICVTDTKADLATGLSDVPVAERLKCGKKERG